MSQKKNLTPLARQFRKRSTDSEKALWKNLRNRQLNGIKFQRQQPIGSYVVDFVSAERKLVVEIDGGHHSESETVVKDDDKRIWLEGEGFQVLRFWNHEVITGMEGVLERIRVSLL